MPALVRGFGGAEDSSREAPTLSKDVDVVPGMLPTPSPPLGITNHDEYSLVRELIEEKKEEVTGTLRKDKTLLRDEKKMEKLKQKLHTDDECKQKWKKEGTGIGLGGRGQLRRHCFRH